MTGQILAFSVRHCCSIRTVVASQALPWLLAMTLVWAVYAAAYQIRFSRLSLEQR
jgi:hypothetical protein